MTVVITIMQPFHIFKKNSLSTFGKSDLTHLTTNVIFSGQPFAIIAMFGEEVAFFVERLRDFLLLRASMILCVKW